MLEHPKKFRYQAQDTRRIKQYSDRSVRRDVNWIMHSISSKDIPDRQRGLEIELFLAI
jgi:hypothetical protein